MEILRRKEWTINNVVGIPCTLSVSELFIDHSYQRPLSNRSEIVKIAKNFRWEAFHSILVMQRTDGRRYVIDGQQRLEAVKLIGNITTVPCLVFQSNGPEHEAEEFLRINVARKTVGALARFKASVQAGLNPETEISTWLASIGLRISDSGSRVPTAIDFSDSLVMTWKRDTIAAKNSIVIQKKINNGEEPMNNLIHKGLWYLFHNGIDVELYADKLISMGGHNVMLMNIRKITIETMTHSSVVSCALGILNMINKGKRNRLTLQKQDNE